MRNKRPRGIITAITLYKVLSYCVCSDKLKCSNMLRYSTVNCNLMSTSLYPNNATVFRFTFYGSFPFPSIFRVRQKYLMILQNSCEWKRWRGEFFLEHSSSETQSISVTMERWSVEYRAFAVVTYFKTNDSVLTQRIFRRHFNIHRNECP
jgi:hypothetical protein